MRISARRRNGFTLVEVMIATAVTLLMLAALAEGFKRIGDAISDNRAALEMSDRLRNLNHRLREDLDGVTVHMRPPLDSQGGLGYFEYYEGPMTDYTAAMFVPLPNDDSRTGTDPSSNVPAARYGDLDDILMFTTQSKGSWFTGKVPRYIALRGFSGGTNPTGWDQGDFEPVVIASQYAEVAWFVRPSKSNALGPADPNFLTSNPVFNIYRRVLLIRPDLNLNGTLFTPDPSLGYRTWMRTLPSPTNPSTDPSIAMTPVHQDCDLSVRRVPDANAGTSDAVAANSLQDLARRENRFAHFVQPVGNSTSMGLLALDNAYEFSLRPFNYTPPTSTLPPVQPLVPQFFLLNDAVGSRSGPLLSDFVLDGERLGEDVVSTFCTSFDLKAFDPEVQIAYLPGADNVYGTPADSSVGSAGSDDIALTPSDPGYSLAVCSGSGLIPGETGEYVDLGWGRNVISMLRTWSKGFGNIAPSFRLVTTMSGLQGSYGNATYYSDARYSDALYRSGLVANTPVGNWCQVTYDSYTNEYEFDGIIHADIAAHFGPAPYNGTMQINNMERYRGGGFGDDSSSLLPWKQVADVGADGIDNIGLRILPPNASPYTYAAFGGVDDVDEIETSAPFPVRLRSLQITTRIEDPDTRQLQQAKVQTEFLTH